MHNLTRVWYVMVTLFIPGRKCNYDLLVPSSDRTTIATYAVPFTSPKKAAYFANVWNKGRLTGRLYTEADLIPRVKPTSGFTVMGESDFHEKVEEHVQQERQQVKRMKFWSEVMVLPPVDFDTPTDIDDFDF